jgi:hypothetical protein
MLWIACTIPVLLAAWFVLRPLFGRLKRVESSNPTAESELDFWLNRKAAVYSNIKDLEFEYTMGRLTEADFKQLRASYKKEAAEILQTLDQLNSYKDLDAEIDKEIALRKSKRVGSKHGHAPNFCPSCGAKTLPGKKFCADCGAQL